MKPIVIPFDPGRLTSNKRLHWAEMARRRKAARASARASWQAAGRPKARGPVRVHVVIRRGRMLDTDNAISGLKAALDGLFVGAITPDDGPEWVTLGDVTQETGKRFVGREEVVVTVETLEGAPWTP